MNIHDLISEIKSWDNTLVGAGYKHPRYPNCHLEEDTKEFWKQFSGLQRDQDYVEFIECYSGLLTIHPNFELLVTIYGLWSDYVTNILYPDEPLIADERYFNFASIVIDSTKKGGVVQVLGFAFDLGATNELPIYLQIITENQHGVGQAYSRYCDNFLEWLKQLVTNSGQLIK